MSREVGNQAEEQAVLELQKRGYSILERNYFARVGEIDIIAEKDDIICFIEVKYRKPMGFGTAVDTVTKSKLNKILKSATRYLFEKNLTDANWRVDVVAINGNTVDMLENVYTEGLS